MSAIKVDDAHEGELGDMSCMNEKEHSPKRLTHKVHVGDVAIGGDSPISVQSMLNAPADDARANLEQIAALEQAGCEIVRMAIPRAACLDAFEKVCSKSPLPVVADIHFDADIACEAARRGASKLRINPGNIGGLMNSLQLFIICENHLSMGVFGMLGLQLAHKPFVGGFLITT